MSKYLLQSLTKLIINNLYKKLKKKMNYQTFPDLKKDADFQKFKESEAVRNEKPLDSENWVSLGDARSKTGISLTIIRSAIKDRMIDEHPTLISYKGNPFVWLPDVEKIANLFRQMERAAEIKIGLLLKEKIADKNKYFIADVHKYKTGKSLTQTQEEFLWKLHHDYFEDKYIMIPKNLPDQEKEKMIKNG